MRLHVNPPLASWRCHPPHDLSRDVLWRIIDDNAKRFGFAGPTMTDAIIATGHQPQLWHPGILAKYVATAHAARSLRTQTLHLIVDQDVHDAWSLNLPTRHGDRLDVIHTRLALTDPNVPAGCQLPVDPAYVVATIDALDAAVCVDMTKLRDAVADLPECGTLAQQMACLLDRLIRPHAGAMPVLFASDLARLPAFDELLQRMLDDPRLCAQTYNTAVEQHPQAHVPLLRIDGDRVELPLWGLQWQQTRRPVMADLAAAPRGATLTWPDGRLINRETMTFAPRALVLTGLMRWWCCDLFVHGTGGAVYDRVTEKWLHDWLGVELAPMAVVTADVHLQFDAPIANRDELVRAHWRAHHLPHNIDRELNLSEPRTLEKCRLIEGKGLDRDQRRRAFERIHAINLQLAAEHADVVKAARDELTRARAGVANHAVATRRDWFFGLYPDAQLTFDLAMP